MTHRGTTNRNERGSAKSRRELKTWMLAEFGDGISVLCAFCQRALLYSTMTKDRFPVPGRRGGRYVKGNVRPACLSCNASEGARQGAIDRTEKKLKHEAQLARRRELYAQKKLRLAA